MSGPDTGPIPRLALAREEAAAALGMSLDSFERHVQPTLLSCAWAGCASCPCANSSDGSRSTPSAR